MATFDAYHRKNKDGFWEVRYRKWYWFRWKVWGVYHYENTAIQVAERIKHTKSLSRI